ncbi:HD domain-containing protein [Bombardia bombarda]|uniref:5'-deoxynucleotidase n=1 Tax=Bombardia bombarda TaxID=252184 RepID=A0AA39XMV6_9PEZI|nr:HD domain-containing protein [Bombardia bombarda]
MSPPSASESVGNGTSATTNGQSVPDVATVPNPEISGRWTVQKVLDTIPGRPVENSNSPLAYFHLLERLKTMKREGWRRFGIQGGESISDHMYRMSMISMLAPPALAAKLDLPKCIKMCLIHDMAESLVGDITPVDGIDKPEKSRREAETMDYITKELLGGVDGGSLGAEIRAIWQEYEDSVTLDSHYVHDIDKMELLLQMVEYEKRGEGKLDLGEFAYVKTRIVLPEVQAWAKDLIAEREAFWDGHSHIDGSAGVEGGVPAEKKEMQDEYYNNGPKQ